MPRPVAGARWPWVVAVLTVVASALVRVSDGVAMKEWMVLTLLGGQAE